MKMTRTSANTTDDTNDSVAFAMALIGVPSQDRAGWLAAETQQRAAEARALGATEQLADDWAAAWGEFVGQLIAASNR